MTVTQLRINQHINSISDRLLYLSDHNITQFKRMLNHFNNALMINDDAQCLSELISILHVLKLNASDKSFPHFK